MPEKQPHSAGSRGHGNQRRLGECGKEVTSWRDIEKAGRKVTVGRVQLGYQRAPRTERGGNRRQEEVRAARLAVTEPWLRKVGRAARGRTSSRGSC